MNKIIFILILQIFTISNIYASDNFVKNYHLENTSPERILFIGNSYLYYNDSLHNHFKRIVEEIQIMMGAVMLNHQPLAAQD